MHNDKFSTKHEKHFGIFKQRHQGEYVMSNTTRTNWFCKYKIAHRGLHNDAMPENSLVAFDNACKLGFAIELDVRLSKDGEVVVFHDFNLKRLCGEDVNLNKLTLSDLKKYHLKGTKHTIPTLKEALDLINGRSPIMIELKPNKRKEHLEEKVYEIIKKYPNDIAIKSFNPVSVLWFKKHAPEVSRGMLAGFLEGIKLPNVYKYVIKRLKFFNLIKPDFISYDFNNLPNKYVSSKNVPVLTWTIRNKEQEKQALEVANNVIFENYIPDSPTNY